jgi:triphosphoribosyl-dephospho-CoA synthetase
MMERNRNSLIDEIKSELEKEAAAIDPGFIDRRIDELYALDGLVPPKLDAVQLCAAARTIRARAAWRRRNTQAKEAWKRRFIRRLIRRLVRGAAAACCLFVLTFSVNYLTALITGSCLPSKAGITICCGTQFCRCDTAQAEETGNSE